MKLPTDQFAWYVLRTKVRAEHLAEDELRIGGYQTYLPRRRIRRFKRRQRIYDDYQQALMPGYLFIAENRVIEWGEIIHDDIRFPHCGKPLKGLVGPLRVPARIIVQINEDEIAGLFDETGATKKANHEKLIQRFPKGSKQRATEGPFSGFEAVVQCVTAKERIKALVQIFGRHVTVEFEPEKLEAA